MDRALVLIVVLIIAIPLLTLELPTLIASTPKWLLKILCFAPLGGILFMEVQAFLQGNTTTLVISLPLVLLSLYGGFTLKSIVDQS